MKNLYFYKLVNIVFKNQYLCQKFIYIHYFMLYNYILLRYINIKKCEP